MLSDLPHFAQQQFAECRLDELTDRMAVEVRVHRLSLILKINISSRPQPGLFLGPDLRPSALRNKAELPRTTGPALRRRVNFPKHVLPASANIIFSAIVTSIERMSGKTKNSLGPLK